jgi:hypothetical protein
MRFLQRSHTGEFSLTEDLVDDDIIPPYAILSHTWEEGQEVTFQDIIDGSGQSKNAMACDTFGWTPSALTNWITGNFGRRSTLCFAGTRTR